MYFQYKVGKLIMEEAAKSNLKRVSLELGGKSPLVIFNDFDGNIYTLCSINFNFITVYNIVFLWYITKLVDKAAQIAHDAVFSNMGQNCCAGSRTFVQEGIYDKFVERSASLASQKKVGNQFDANTEIGPLVRF